MFHRRVFPPMVLGLLLTTAACSATGQPTGAPSAAASAALSPSPSVAGIAHPSGSSEIVLRFDEAGGFLPPEFFAAHVPIFTLYGDGTVVFVSNAPAPAGPAGAPMLGSPVRTGKLSEKQVQDLLEFALEDGGLALARANYDNPRVADAPTAVFEVHAEGDAKTVSISALGMGADEPGPDSAIKAAFVKLADRLRDFDQGGTIASAAYEPARYRGILLESNGVQGVAVRPWPWASIAPSDFALPPDPTVLQQATRTLTPDEARKLGVTGIEAGAQGIWLRASDATVYSFVLRPLLPDEAK